MVLKSLYYIYNLGDAFYIEKYAQNSNGLEDQNKLIVDIGIQVRFSHFCCFGTMSILANRVVA